MIHGLSSVKQINHKQNNKNALKSKLATIMNDLDKTPKVLYTKTDLCTIAKFSRPSFLENHLTPEQKDILQWRAGKQRFNNATVFDFLQNVFPKYDEKRILNIMASV